MSPAPPPAWRENTFRLGVLPVAALHVGLSLWSALEPARATLGDRATTRLEDMAALAGASDRWSQLVLHGAPGDYAIHGLLHMLGGLPLLLFVQLAAFLATLYWLYDLARRLDAPGWAAAVAATAFALLPSNLHQPHTIVTEALVNPLIAWCTREAVRSLGEGHIGAGRTIAMGAAMGAAAMIRPFVLPAVPALGCVLLHVRAMRARQVVALQLLAIVPLAAFAAASMASGEDLELGGRRASLGANLFRRMKRIEQLSQRPIPDGIQYRASVGQYLAYGLDEPAAFVRLHATDSVLLTLNTGVNHTFGRFLGLFEMREGSHYWTPLIEERGLLSASRELLRREPARLIANGLVGGLWLAFCIGSIVGAARAIRDPTRRGAVLLIASVAIFAVVGAYASHYARWSQRSPAEFGLAALLALGLAEAEAAWRRWRASPG
jgi:hypothetical protein